MKDLLTFYGIWAMVIGVWTAWIGLIMATIGDRL